MQEVSQAPGIAGNDGVDDDVNLRDLRAPWAVTIAGAGRKDRRKAEDEWLYPAHGVSKCHNRPSRGEEQERADMPSTLIPRAYR
jgi:hypothetical protein